MAVKISLDLILAPKWKKTYKEQLTNSCVPLTPRGGISFLLLFAKGLLAVVRITPNSPSSCPVPNSLVMTPFIMMPGSLPSMMPLPARSGCSVRSRSVRSNC
jgi:hypothetical protein